MALRRRRPRVDGEGPHARRTSTPRWRASSAWSGCSPATKPCRPRAFMPAKRCGWCAATTRRWSAIRRVTASYPSSPWAARANLAAGYCLVQADRAAAALPEVQRVRQMHAGEPRSGRGAQHQLDPVSPLRARAEGRPAFTFSGRFIGDERANFDDVIGVKIDPLEPRAARPQQAASRCSMPKGTLTSTVAAQDPSAFFVDEVEPHRVRARRRRCTPSAWRRWRSRCRRSRPSRRVRSRRSGRARRCRPAIGSSSTRRRRPSFATTPTADTSGTFMPAINTERMAINALDDVAMIDKDAKAITILDRDGKPLSKILPRARTTSSMSRSISVFDRLGHLYVLDRGKSSVYVFGPRNRLITSVHDGREDPRRVHQGPRAGTRRRRTALHLRRASRSESRFTNEHHEHTRVLRADRRA